VPAALRLLRLKVEEENHFLAGGKLVKVRSLKNAVSRAVYLGCELRLPAAGKQRGVDFGGRVYR